MADATVSPRPKIGDTIYCFTVLEVMPAKARGGRLRVRCKCGTIQERPANRILTGHTKSCGCFNLERLSETKTKHGQNRSSQARTFEYAVWRNMKSRCYNEKVPAWKDYGGRGITVCPEWLNDFSAFFRDMGQCPGKGFSLDRIDNNKGYSKENCRWATKREQAQNRSWAIVVEYDGRPMPLAEAARLSGKNYFTLRSRVKRGVPPSHLFL